MNINKDTAFRYAKITLLFFLGLYITTSYAQQKPRPIVNAALEGTVIDAITKKPLEGVTLQLDGVTHSVKTNHNGEFQFVTGQKLPFTINVTYIGYEKKILDVNSSPTVIELEPSTESLDEIVVVGYGQKKKSNITGAVSQVNGANLSNNLGTSFTEKLQGLAPGVQISSSSGVEGGSALVRLRGATSINANNDPLYIIDGVFINSSSLQSVGAGGQTSNPLADINPADIETIEVYKDANATAVYGARGANGVIVITTKKGKKGERTEVNFNSTFGIAKAPKLWELVTGPEHATILNEQWINDGGTYETRPYRPVSEGGQGLPEEQGTYDRLGLIFRTTNQTINNLSVRGGSDKTSFYVSGEINNSPSILKLQSFNRKSFRSNLDHNIANNLQIGTNISYSLVNRETVPTGDTGGITNTGLHTPTLTPILNADGSYNRGERFNNPYVLLENSNSHAYTKRF